MWPSDIAVHGRLARVGPAASMEAGMLSWLHASSDSGGMFRGRQHLTLFK
jgi:hypothetical protein